MKRILVLVLILFSNCYAKKDYINTYFPEDSIVRRQHNNQPHGTGWFGFDNDVRAACDRLNGIFESIEEKTYNTYSPYYYDVIESLVKTITGTLDQKIVENELDWAWELKVVLEKEAEKRYYHSAEYEQVLAREKK